ncbi:hypothetical protein ACI2KT_08625 [Ensifer adhaerens]|uniref:hypothetical protein n=1 Tax=Ensifer TaxID=106591 RepID=UPI00177F493A|nr:hypothetical protein [Ensifer sp. ENS08]MBD9568528.1 hypothetical protein [Ensifer sp. ENS08]
MKKFVIALLSGLLIAGAPMAGAASAATVTNKDSETAVLIVVEGESRVEVAIASGATEMICPSGCFVTAPSGDRIGLQGDENVEIVNGNVVVK